MKMTDLNLKVEGYVKIIDLDTNKVLVEGSNAIHSENVSLAIANSWGTGGGILSEMHFGNGASIITAGQVIYRPANIIGQDADLYHPIYYRIVDQLDFNNLVPKDNNITVEHLVGASYSDLIVTCTLDYDDPSSTIKNGGFVKSQSTATLDNQVDNGTMWFDEIGLKSRGNTGPDSGYLLTHYRFHPIQKTEGQRMQVVYSLRIRA
jgi:hypothetical protein